MSKTARFYLLISTISLVIATTLMTGLRLAAKANGWHSTAAIWLAFFNFPGVFFLTRSEGWFNVGLATVTNAALYFLIMKFVQTLKKPS
jgi:hypothetical protein